MELSDKQAYTLEEIACLTGFSRKTVARLFDDEPGIIVLERPTKMNKRRYRSVRIPLTVYERVIRRLTQR